MRNQCILELSTGEAFEGKLIGAPVDASGELVFTTGMVGYSEAITDPSYYGQILCFTYPLIGNYGIPSASPGFNPDLPRGFESARPQAAAIVISVDSHEVFHWNSFSSLDTWLKQNNVPGIVGMDTRDLVHRIRSTPNLMARVNVDQPEGERYPQNPDTFKSKSKFFDPGAHNIVKEVSVKEPIKLGKGKTRIGVVDCGVKWNIIRQLVSLGCEVEILPWNSDLSTKDVSGWLLSNGPGDPTKTENLTKGIAQLLKGDKPVFGICLGHQLLSLAAGCETRRMPYGHRSHNQPVYVTGTRRGYITTQNHGYVVVDSTLPQDWDVWFRNVNDQTVEGVKHKTKPFQSVQFHPEASGGPRDTGWLLKDFVERVIR
ncbi:MAG: glutamine-hydrolyzing carbamoyl-phosphate synthase small subunit [Oligoflexales bacterium]